MKKHTLKKRGATTVEFAIVLPIVFLIMFGLLEWARFEMVRQVSSTAAFQAARIGSLPGATEEGTIDAAEAILSAYFVSDATVDVTLGDNETAVAITIPVSSNSFVVGGFFDGKVIQRDFVLQIF